VTVLMIGTEMGDDRELVVLILGQRFGRAGHGRAGVEEAGVGRIEELIGRAGYPRLGLGVALLRVEIPAGLSWRPRAGGAAADEDDLPVFRERVEVAPQGHLRQPELVGQVVDGDEVVLQDAVEDELAPLVRPSWARLPSSLSSARLPRPRVVSVYQGAAVDL
jgi:hypothetical protein